MSTVNIILLLYFVIGIILAFVWWNDEYKPETEVEDEDVESSMVCIFLLFLVVFWPIKLVKNWIENFMI